MTNEALRAKFEEIFDAAVAWISEDNDHPDTPSDEWLEAREEILASIGFDER